MKTLKGKRNWCGCSCAVFHFVNGKELILEHLFYGDACKGGIESLVDALTEATKTNKILYYDYSNCGEEEYRNRGFINMSHVIRVEIGHM